MIFRNSSVIFVIDRGCKIEKSNLLDSVQIWFLFRFIRLKYIFHIIYIYISIHCAKLFELAQTETKCFEWFVSRFLRPLSPPPQFRQNLNSPLNSVISDVIVYRKISLSSWTRHDNSSVNIWSKLSRRSEVRKRRHEISKFFMEKKFFPAVLRIRLYIGVPIVFHSVFPWRKIQGHEIISLGEGWIIHKTPDLLSTLFIKQLALKGKNRGKWNVGYIIRIYISI